MSRKPKRKQPTLERATPPFPSGGALMYLSPQRIQAFYGKTNAQMPLFDPGTPLAPQPNVNPQNRPVQWRFPVAYNTFPIDRSLGMPDIPSFETLRRLAKMYSGITLCERFWMDMVPRMKLEIKLKKEFVDGGAEDKDYQKEITYFKNFFDKPDGKQDLHTWIRKALREQTQIDELYLYKNRTRGGKLLGLWIVAGDQMKPLLDDWGMLPDAPNMAYQQFPWGIPGMQYSTDMLIHYQESPAADTPYGFSRVERIILEVNQALKKKKKDLSYFTEGNIPQAFMEVPENSQWMPDDIDAYAQSFNAMVAGNAQQQVRMIFMQPGMKYIPTETYQMLSDFDKFLLNICVATYGISMAELSFTEDVNKSSGDSQEDMTYRRTIGPLADMYGYILTGTMNNDFSPEYHGEMFEAVFAGFEEVEDEAKKATAITTYTGAGILGLTDAAKLANLPVDPEAPRIGRVYMSAQGPIFLDDVATPEMRKAQQQATMAGYQMAQNPPEQGNADEEDPNQKGTEKAETNTGQKSKTSQTADDEDKAQKRTQGQDALVLNRETLSPDDRTADYRRWRSRAIEDVKQQKKQRSFISTTIPEYVQAYISFELERCVSTDEVRELFKRVQEHQMEAAK